MSRTNRIHDEAGRSVISLSWVIAAMLIICLSATTALELAGINLVKIVEIQTPTEEAHIYPEIEDMPVLAQFIGKIEALRRVDISVDDRLIAQVDADEVASSGGKIAYLVESSCEWFEGHWLLG